FEAAVAEIVEDMAGEQEQRLGGCGAARDRRVPEDVADLDDAIGGIHAHEGLPAGYPVARPVDHGEMERGLAGGGLVEPGLEVGAASGDLVVEPAEAFFAVWCGCGLVEPVAVASGIEWLQPHVTAFHDLSCR